MTYVSPGSSSTSLILYHPLLRAMVQRTILRVIRSENDSPKKTPIEAKARRDEPRY